MGRVIPFAAIVVIALAGCERKAPAVPKVDFSTSNVYKTAEFKDSAPANASPGDFPMSFIDSDGNPVDLTKFRGEKKVVLVVLRGMPKSEQGRFCPSCLAQTGGLLANREEFTRRGAEVLVVYPGATDRIGEFLETARQSTPGEPERAFRVLVDRDCGACSRLGIRADLAKPSTYILDLQGKLVYAYVGESSTDRPSIKALLTQLDKAN